MKKPDGRGNSKSKPLLTNVSEIRGGVPKECVYSSFFVFKVVEKHHVRIMRRIENGFSALVLFVLYLGWLFCGHFSSSY